MMTNSTCPLWAFACRRGGVMLVAGVLAGLGLMMPRVAPAQLTDSDFVLIKPGTFQMGDISFGPAHTVTLTRGFWLQKTEVTQAQWQAVTGSNPSSHRGCRTCPVETVSWDDVQAFIAKLGSLTGKKYRLPTEAEWEYAARAGTTGDYGTPGAVTLGGWVLENSGNQSHPVGGLRPNAWGLYDMEGNVWEWVNDWYARYPSGPVTDPIGPASGATCVLGQVCRVLRGGSYLNAGAFARSAFRFMGGLPASRISRYGFRLARTE